MAGWGGCGWLWLVGEVVVGCGWLWRLWRLWLVGEVGGRRAEFSARHVVCGSVSTGSCLKMSPHTIKMSRATKGVYDFGCKNIHVCAPKV